MGYRCMCFSSGDLTQLAATTGTPLVNSTNNPPYATYSLYLDNPGDLARYTISAGSTYRLMAFKIRFDAISPSVPVTFAYIHNGTVKSSPGLMLNTDNTISIVNSSDVVQATSIKTISSEIWHQVVLYWKPNSTATTYLYINGDTFIQSSITDSTNAGAYDLAFEYPTNGVAFRVSEILHEFSSTDFFSTISPYGYDVYEFMVSGSGFTTSGDALSVGTWDLTGEQPTNSTNNAQYTGTSMSGYAWMNGTSKGGPSGKNFNGKQPHAYTPTNYVKRGTGSSTTHTIYTGNSVDGTDITQPVLSTSYQWFEPNFVDTAYLPELSEFALTGMAVSGAQDILLAESYFVYTVKRPIPILNPLFKRRPYSVRI